MNASPQDAAAVAAVRRRYSLERPYVICVGTLEPRKNLAALLPLGTELDRRGVDLVFVGPSGWADVHATVTRAPSVRWLGLCPAPTGTPSLPGPTWPLSPAWTRVSACRSWRRWPRGRRW